MTTPEPTAIKRAVELFGSQLALAKALGVTAVTVNQWVRQTGTGSSRPVPPKQCVRIEVLTDGKVTRRDLRPADWCDLWPELATNFEQKSTPALTSQAQAATQSEVA